MVHRFKFLSIIVPTFKEVGNLRPLITRIAAVMDKVSMPYELIVVDDDSQDGSSEIINELAEKDYPVHIITRIAERGLSTAVIHGFNEAKGDVLVCMNADLSHPPEVLLCLIKVFEDSKVEFAIGSRYVPGASTAESWGMFRWLNSKIATMLARPFTNVKDPMAGFFMLPRSVFKRARSLNPIGYKIGLELIAKCSCHNIVEVPINFENRTYGQSKLNIREQFNYIKHLKRLWDFKLGDLSYFFQFCIVGSTGMIVDLFMYSFLLVVEVPLPLARALSIWVAMTWNFWLNRRLTFSYSRKGKILQQYIKFFSTCVLGAIISWSIGVFIPQKADMFADYILPAAVAGICAGTLLNFFLSRSWVFRKFKYSPKKMTSSKA